MTLLKMDNACYICDTNVFLSALLSKKSIPYKVVSHLLEKRTLALSQETLAELEDVLSRKKFDRFISKETRQTFMENIKRNAVFYDIYNPINLCRDPKDNKFLDVAIASYADYLITGDDDLLVLKVIGNTTIITPRAFADTFALDKIS